MKFPKTAKLRTRRMAFRPGRAPLHSPLPFEPFSEVSSDHLIRAGRTAMACRFEILIPSRERHRIRAVQHALDEIDRLEDQMSSYRDWSEICEINQIAAERPVQVEENLFGLLKLAARLSHETGGAFDLTAGPLSRCWGFFTRQGRLPTQEEIDKARTRTGWRYLEFDEETRRISFRRPLELNLGAIGKGFALDRALLHLQRTGINDVLLHAGYSSILAVGAAPGEEGDSGWPVGIRHPLDPRVDLALLRLRNQAMSTSGVSEQHFEAAGRRYGHVIDPRTGEPAGANLSTTAVADTAAKADALSTAFFVMSLEEIEAYCRRHPGIGAIVVPRQKDDRGCRVHPIGIDSGFLEAHC